MRRSSLMIALGVTAISFSTLPSHAQSNSGSETGLPEQNLSDEAQSLLDEPADASNETNEDIASDGVSVSLGDWDVRTTISEELDIPISDVPLTVAIEPDLASSICPVRESDLAQQEIVSAIRTCAAKSVNDDLLAAVTTSFEQPEAEALEMAPIDENGTAGGSATSGSSSADGTGSGTNSSN